MMLQNYRVILLLLVAIWNFVVFILFGIDKFKAIKGKRRIPEKTLLLCSFLLGGVGGLAGMFAFRHKTRHLKFRVLLPVAAVITLAPVIYFVYTSV